MTLLPILNTPIGGLHRLRSSTPVPGEGQDLLARPLSIASGAAREELLSLARESDPALRSEGLLNFGVRQEQAGQLELAAAVFQSVTNLPGGSLQARARGRLDAILGRGAFGNRAEYLLRNLAQEAADPSTLLALVAAGAVFRMTRLTTLSRLASTSNPGILTRLLGAGRLASVAGFALEAPTFTLVGRLGNEALGRSQDWNLRSLARDMASSYLVLGGLKFTGALGGAAAARMEASPALANLLHQGSMFTGILLGHRLEAWVGLRSVPDRATTLTDSLALLLQFHVAGNLARGALGPHFATWEQGLDLQSRALESAPLDFPFSSGLSGLQPALALAGEAPRRLAPEPARENLMMMAGRERASARAPALPVGVRYWLALVDNPKAETGLGAAARLVENLRTGEGLNSRQYLDLFHHLNTKLESFEIHSETYDFIVNSLNELLVRVDLANPGPRGLFQDLMRSHRVVDAIVPGYYGSLLANPNLGVLERERIVNNVADVLNDEHRNDSPHDAALSLLLDAPLDRDSYARLATTASNLAARESSWFNNYYQASKVVHDLVLDSRAPSIAKTQLLDTFSRGLRDPEVPSAKRAEIISVLEGLARVEVLDRFAGEWFQVRMPELRVSFAEDNFDELRRNPKTFNNLEELGYLLLQDYVAEEARVVVAQELLEAFRQSSPTSGRYDHFANLALHLAPDPRIPVEARRCLWSILFKTDYDLSEAPQQSEIFGERRMRFSAGLQEALSGMPRPERDALALHWLDRMKLPNPSYQYFAAAILKSVAPYLEPNFELRRRLTEAQASPVPELRNLADSMLLQFNQVN